MYCAPVPVLLTILQFSTKVSRLWLTEAGVGAASMGSPVAGEALHLTLRDGRRLQYSVYGHPLDSQEPPAATIVHHHG